TRSKRDWSSDVCSSDLDLIWDKPYVKNDRYLGVAFKPGMGQDNSEVRMCDWRCFDAIDTMNNMYAGQGLRPKYAIADIDTYKKEIGRASCRERVEVSVG